MNENPFLRHLTNITSEILMKYKGNNLVALIRDPKLEIKFLKDEDYVVKTILSLGEVESVFVQLEQAPFFLSNFRQTQSLKEVKINRFHHIIYHIESHLFRATGILDRVLIHVNVVFMLNLSPEQCKAYNFLTNGKGKDGKYAVNIKNRNQELFSTLIKLMDLIETIRDSRNKISHQYTYSSEKLRYVEMYHILQQESDEEFSRPPFKKHIKKETDKAVVLYKNNMLEFNSKIRTLLDDIFIYLELVWRQEYEKMHTRLSTY